MNTKYCSKCEQTRPVSEFSKRPKSKDGLRSNCKICEAAAYSAWREKNIEHVAAASKARRLLKKPKISEANKSWRLANPEKHAANGKAWRESHPGYSAEKSKAKYLLDPEAARARSLVWAKENPDKATAIVRRRSAAKINATPSWSDGDAILKFYAEAKQLTQETGVVHHVDHIVPLRHKKVCGLHVHQNLQVLTATENLKKGNRFDI